MVVGWVDEGSWTGVSSRRSFRFVQSVCQVVSRVFWFLVSNNGLCALVRGTVLETKVSLAGGAVVGGGVIQ